MINLTTRGGTFTGYSDQPPIIAFWTPPEPVSGGRNVSAPGRYRKQYVVAGKCDRRCSARGFIQSDGAGAGRVAAQSRRRAGQRTELCRRHQAYCVRQFHASRTCRHYSALIRADLRASCGEAVGGLPGRDSNDRGQREIRVVT